MACSKYRQILAELKRQILESGNAERISFSISPGMMACAVFVMK